MNYLQSLGHLAEVNLETHKITADLTETKKFSKSLRRVINILTFGIYGYYVKCQTMSVAKKIAKAIRERNTLPLIEAEKETFAKAVQLAEKLQDKLEGTRHQKACQIMSRVLEFKQPILEPKQPTKEECQQIIEASDRLASNLRKKLAEKNPNQTFVFSIPSLLSVLSMALKGLTLDNKEAYKKSLGLEGMEEDRIHVAVGKMIDLLSLNTPDARCILSNACLTTRGLSEDFIDTVRRDYRGEVFVGASGEVIGQRANAYVKEKTNGMIQEIVTPSNDLLSVILNTLYFKGMWDKPFKEESTTYEEFTCMDGSKKEVAILDKTEEDLAYLETDDYQMVEKHYKAEDLSFVAFLPKEGKSLEDLEANMTGMRLTEARSNAKSEEVHIQLPKIDIEASPPKLIQTLKEMGFRFGGGLEGQPIEDIIQKIKMRIDEQGTEAAAVTVMWCIESAPRPPKEFLLNRPFMYVIRCGDYILFQGSIRSAEGMQVKSS